MAKEKIKLVPIEDFRIYLKGQFSNLIPKGEKISKEDERVADFILDALLWCEEKAK